MTQSKSAFPHYFERIIQIATRSPIMKYRWLDRGVAPSGYIKGMALALGRAHCRLKINDKYIMEMAKGETSNKNKDVLTYYKTTFQSLGMDNSQSGPDTLRHLFTLLLGLGMRESSGRWCEGRDMAAHNTASDTAEAGLFQTSWNAHEGNPLLLELYNSYASTVRPSSLFAIFNEGVRAKAADLENFGSGEGVNFQKLTKYCPEFAIIFAGIGLRNIRDHWGPINRQEAEIRPEANELFLAIQKNIDASDACDDLIGESQAASDATARGCRRAAEAARP
uniref:Uncharacterized protein n=1 Tax=Desulfovibrio sp. U5L TaxID=596152 RepID=I2Q270_9BACT